jgi:hypothetical protein
VSLASAGIDFSDDCDQAFIFVGNFMMSCPIEMTFRMIIIITECFLGPALLPT